MLDLRGGGRDGETRIVQTVAAWGQKQGSGMAELAQAIEEHRDRMVETEQAERLARRRARSHVTELVRALLTERAEAALAAQGGLDELAERVAARTEDPYTAAERIVAGL